MWAAEASRGGGCFLSTHWAPSSPLLLASPTLARCEPFIFAASCAAARMSLLIRNIVQSGCQRSAGRSGDGILARWPLNREHERKEMS